MRIETYFARPELDGRSGGLAARLERRLVRPLSLRIVDVILTDFPVPRPLAEELFRDPVVERVAELPAPQEPGLGPWDWLVEIAFKPGVTDTLALTAREAFAIGLGAPLSESATVQTARLYVLALPAETGERGVLKGLYPDRAAVEAAFAPLWNPLIQVATFLSRREWEAGARLPDLYPTVSIADPAEPELIDLVAMDDVSLARLSSERLLALSIPEMRAIRAYYERPETQAARAAAGLPREATDVELEMLAQTWSEHCKHKIFNAEIEYEERVAPGEEPRRELIRSLFKTYIRATTEELAPSRPDLLSVFTDNAGVFRFDEEYVVCMKAETHNSPSALDPYGGAITGIVGVNRDILGTGIGAAPLFNTDVLCFAPPSTPDEEVPAGLIKPRELLAGVHRGIVDGGNQSGIPCAAGAFVFDESFMGKPLVFCGTGGIMPARINDRPSWEKTVRPGDLAVMLGGRIGKDGIHGATFSSLALDESSPVTAVQIGDPIIQKRMSDFLLEARDAGLYAGITDNGAGGLSSSLGEMAGESGGARIDLAACPRKYPGLSPWEVLVSESQERMSLAVPPDKRDAFMALARRRGVEASVVGEFTDSGWVEIFDGTRPVGLLALAFLHTGLPTMSLRAVWCAQARPAVPLSPRESWNDELLAVLADPDIASKEPLVRYYDHEVKAISVEKPFTGCYRDAPSDGGVVKPRYDSYRGLTVTHGIAPRLSAEDPAAMALAAVDEAYRAHIALGGDPDRAVALDNFCWPDPVESPENPDGAQKLGGLVRACRALREACLAYGLPLVSGKDSMKNDATAGGRRISVKPTLLVTVVGITGDVRKTPSTDFLGAGELLYLVGEGGGWELGCSVLERVLAARSSAHLRGEDARRARASFSLGAAPRARPRQHAPTYRALARAISGRAARSVHDLSDGGLAVALAESCLGGRLGAEVRLDGLAEDIAESSAERGLGPTELAARLLFSEVPGRLLVAVRAEDRERFERSMSGEPCRLIGKTSVEARLRATLAGKALIDLGLDALERAFKTPIV